jgi:transposase
LTYSEILIGLPGYQITGIEQIRKQVRIGLRYEGGPVVCPHCGVGERRSKGWCVRAVRHDDWGLRPVVLQIELRKWLCKGCGRQYRDRLPGILPSQRASEAFQQAIYEAHLDGINRSRLGRRKGIGAATVERYFQHGLQRQFAQWHPPKCPLVLGIDEHFFTRRKGYATTFCDLKNHKIYDVVLGRTELSLETYLQRLEGKDQVRVVCMDLASVYRSIARKHFPNAIIVADRFHVIRLINHHFQACWRELDPVGCKHRGLLSLMRRHRHNLSDEQQTRLGAYLAQFPALELIYRFKQKLCYLLLKKHRTRKQCQPLACRFLRAVQELRQSGFSQLATWGDTLFSWRNEIEAMWRFTKNNGITEGFHTKMEMISRQAFRFRNFENYRKRVKVLCGGL